MENDAFQLYPKLFEVSWETGNKLGGIYTVLKTKAAVTVQEFGDRYCLIGPLINGKAQENLEVLADKDSTSEIPCIHTKIAISAMKKFSPIRIITGRWLVPGNPRIILFDLSSVRFNLNRWTSDLYLESKINFPPEDVEMQNVVLFGYCVSWFLGEWVKSSNDNSLPKDLSLKNKLDTNDLLCNSNINKDDRSVQKFIGKCNLIIVHYHEWMGALAAILTKSRGLHSISSIFTTHATLLGRYLCASNEIDFYNEIWDVKLDEEAGKRGIYHRYCVERGATHCSSVFTTVSHITAFEAEHLLGRRADGVLPNGLFIPDNITDEHCSKGKAPIPIQNNLEIANNKPELQNDKFNCAKLENLSLGLKKSHLKESSECHSKLLSFVKGHFNGYCESDLGQTIFMFAAGRYEYRNKGFDIFLESLARLNWLMKSSGDTKTVIVFIIMPVDGTNGYNEETLYGQEVALYIEGLSKKFGFGFGEKVYSAIRDGSGIAEFTQLEEEDFKILNGFCDVLNTKKYPLPPIVTHKMPEDGKLDQVLCELRRLRLLNHLSDRVKIVFHPQFLISDNNIFGLDYQDFIRANDLGVFPSYYEPWGYTPGECAVSGVPSVTSNLSGFGCYIAENVVDPSHHGVYILDRRCVEGNGKSIEQLTNILHSFCNQTDSERKRQRKRTEELGKELLDWRRLGMEYQKARMLALKRTHPNLDLNQILPRLLPLDQDDGGDCKFSKDELFPLNNEKVTQSLQNNDF